METPDGHARQTPTTWLVCVRGDGGRAPALRRQLERLCADGGRDVLAVGWGPPEPTEALLRDLAGRHPRLRVVLHSRRVSQTEALCAGVAATHSPWILLPGPDAAPPSPPPAPPAADVACVELGTGSMLFARAAFARLPPVPGMARWLPELFARAGMQVERTGTAPPATWTRRARIALLCTMATLAAPAASRA